MTVRSITALSAARAMGQGQAVGQMGELDMGWLTVPGAWASAATAGGAAVAARHLANRGWKVTIHVAPSATLGGITAHQVELARLAGAELTDGIPQGAGLVLDGLLGYGQAGPPRAPQAGLIAAVRDRRVVGLDVPSGLELATAILHDPAIRAEATLTLAAPKAGGGRRGAAVVTTVIATAQCVDASRRARAL